MKEQIKFTEAEQFLISYYRNPWFSSWSRTLGADGAYLLLSLLFVVLCFVRGDAAWGLVGYSLLFYRLIRDVWQSRRWTPTFTAILEKYESRIAELTAELEKQSESQIKN